MKKKEQAPHDEIKAYLKTCKERIEQAFFTRPEWRHPKTAAGVNVIISRLNEVYYPFADKKNPKLAVWKQVLRKKREEMIEEIEARETQDKENKIKVGGVVKEPVRLIEPGFKGSPAAFPFFTNVWTKERIAKLKADIKHRRIGSEIARRLGIHTSYVGWILTKGTTKSQAEWLPKIAAELDELEAKRKIRQVDPVLTQLAKGYKKAELKAQIHSGDMVFQNEKGELIPKEKDNSLRDRSFVALPQTQASLISNLDVEIKDGKLHVHVVVDAEAAFGMYKERHCSIANDEIKFTME